MRIGIVLSKPPGYSETFFRSKIKGLQNRGHEVVLFVNYQRGETREPPCEIRSGYRVDSKAVYFQVVRTAFIVGLLALRAFGSVRRFWLFEKADGSSPRIIVKKLYVNAHLLDQNLDWLHFGFASMALGRENVARAIGAKMAVSFRGYDVCTVPLRNGFDCYRAVWPKLDKIHTISTDLLHIARRRLGLPKGVVVQSIPPAIEVDRFKRGNLNGEVHAPTRILTVARLEWKKGLDYSIEACARLKAEGQEFYYTIVGEGRCYEQLSFMIHLLKLESCVFLVGRKSPSEVADLMWESDVYIQPSVSEGFCNAVLEAQAAGLLCIVSDAEGLPENVIDCKTGWVVPKRNLESLTEKIHEVIGMNNQHRLQIRARSIARVTQDFSLKDQVRSWNNFYE